MNTINQDLFWTKTYPIITLLIGSSFTFLIFFFKERLRRKTKLKLEKLRIYDKKRFKAYFELNKFIGTAYSFWPPNEPRRDFIDLMKGYYYPRVRIYYPYFKKNIREKLKTLESQYDCLGNPDLYPKIPFDKFYKTDYLNILNTLNTDVEKIFDKWELN